MKKPKWALHVDIYEPEGVGMDYPILRHSFFGVTKAEAQGYFDAHMTTDAFMRGCVERGKWTSVKCRSFARWEKLG